MEDAVSSACLKVRKVLIESVLVSYAVQLFVRFSNVGISVHDHCGRSFVCRFDDDASAFLEFVNSFFLLMGELCYLGRVLVTYVVSRCLLLLLRCKFPVELDGFVGVSSCSSLWIFFVVWVFQSWRSSLHSMSCRSCLAGRCWFWRGLGQTSILLRVIFVWLRKDNVRQVNYSPWISIMFQGGWGSDAWVSVWWSHLCFLFQEFV